MYIKYIIRILIFGAIGLLGALIAAKLNKPIYEGRMEMLLGEAPNPGRNYASTMSDDVVQIINRGSPGGARTERQVLSSQSVFFQALDEIATRESNTELRENWVDYYRMYDIETARTTNDQNDSAGIALIKVRTHDAKVSAAIANQIEKVYNEVRARNAREAVQSALQYVNDQIDASQKKLKESEQALEKFKADHKITDLDLAKRDVQGLRSTLEQQLQVLQTNLKQSEAEVASLQASVDARPKNDVNSRSEVRNPVVSQIEGAITDAERKRAEYVGRYFEDAPQVKELDDQIRSLKQQLASAQKTKTVNAGSNTSPESVRNGLEQQLAGGKARVAGLRDQIAETRNRITEIDGRLATFPETERLIIQMGRELTIVDENYRRYKAMAEELKNRSVPVRAAFVLNRAEPDPDPIAPDMQKWAFIGAIGGLAIGLLYVVTLDSLKLRARNSAQLTDLTGLPVVAAVPTLPRSAAAGSIRGLARADTTPAEAFSYMATTLVSNAHDQLHTYLFTGVKGTAGSYNSAVQFALAAARTGEKVILVDGDLLRSPITKGFDATGRAGLSNMLGADGTGIASTTLIETAHKNLYLVPAGTNDMKFVTDAPNQNLEEVVAALSKLGDKVVFALPPCDILADAATMAQYVDEICLVVSATSTPYRAIPQAYELMQKVGAKRVSLVLLDANPDEEAFGRKRAYLARRD